MLFHRTKFYEALSGGICVGNQEAEEKPMNFDFEPYQHKKVWSHWLAAFFVLLRFPTDWNT